MLYLEKFIDFGSQQPPTIHINNESRVFIVDNIAYGFDMKRIGLVNGITEGLTAADLWNNVKKGTISAFGVVKDAMWSSIVPPKSNIKTTEGMIEWGHYILGLGSLILGLTGIGQTVSIAIDFIDGGVHFVEAMIKKIKQKLVTLESWASIISAGITIGGAFMGGRAVSGPILKAVKAEAKELAVKVVAKKVSKEGAVKLLLGQGNATKTFNTFLASLKNKSFQSKLKSSFATFALFVKEIPMLKSAVKFIDGFARDAMMWVEEGVKWLEGGGMKEVMAVAKTTKAVVAKTATKVAATVAAKAAPVKKMMKATVPVKKIVKKVAAVKPQATKLMKK